MVESLEEFLDEFETDFFPEQSSDCPPEIYLKFLKEWFGHSKFRPMQWKVISSILENKQDNCVVFSTGYGKSLCYQFPSVFLDTVTVIISPLIALMEDQVLSLTVLNIRACLLGTAQKDNEILSKVFKFKYNLIYVSPEFITGDLGTKILLELRQKLTLIAIDEAHCISKWGHDFRPAFRNLACLRRLVPEVPILALTATATEQVRNDIAKSLHLKNPQILYSGIDRPNLEFTVLMKGNQGIWADIGTILQSIKIGSIIIYCITRSDTEKIAELAHANGINCAAYHAGLTIKQRKALHEDFVKDKIQVVVATIAFGMGIDKPDVRSVIHYGVSKDIESYYQEVGRAGRDGMPAKCILFYSRADFSVQKSIRKRSIISQEIQRNLELLSLKMKEYVNTDICRRRFLLDYFEGSLVSLESRKNCCDNCRNRDISKKYEDLDENGLYDFTKDAENLMKAIEAFNGYTGLQKPILLLRGSIHQQLPSKYYSHLMYGVGKSKSEEWYKSVADLLETNKYLEKRLIQSPKFTKTYYKSYGISLSKKAIDWLGNPQRFLKLKPHLDMYRYFRRIKTQFLNDTNLTIGRSINNAYEINSKKDDLQEVLKALHRVRSFLASGLDVMPYMIASNKALHQIAQRKPLNIDEMKTARFDGFSEIKVTKFGPAFIKCILEYINFIPTSPANSLDIKNLLKENPLPGAKLTETHLRTFDLWKTGKSVAEIAQIRDLSENTVSNYMNELVRNGFCATKTDLRRLGVADINFKTITNTISDFSSVKLNNIKEACGPAISYDMIKYVVSYCQVRVHLRNQKLEFLDPDDNSQNSEIFTEGAKIDNYYSGSNIDINFYGPSTTYVSTNSVECSEILSKISEVSTVRDEIIDNWDSDSDIYFKDLDAVVKQYDNSSIYFGTPSDKSGESVKSSLEYNKNKLDLCLFNIRKAAGLPTLEKSKSREENIFQAQIISHKKNQRNSDNEDIMIDLRESNVMKCENSQNTSKRRKLVSRSKKIQYENSSSSEDDKPRQKYFGNSFPNSNTEKKSIKSVFN